MTTQRPPLNQGQQAAADGFFDFLFSADKELIISGPGGVGKSFLMGYLIDEIMPRYEKMCSLLNQPAKYLDVHMTATTNKAAEVLAQADKRALQIIEDAKVQARIEADKIIAGAQAEIEQEAARVKEDLRERVAELAVAGAEKILRREVDLAAHAEMLASIKQEL